METKKITGIKVSDQDYEHEILSCDGGDIHHATITFRSKTHETGIIYEARKDGSFVMIGLNEVILDNDTRDSLRTIALDTVLSHVFGDLDCYCHTYTFANDCATYNKETHGLICRAQM